MNFVLQNCYENIQNLISQADVRLQFYNSTLHLQPLQSSKVQSSASWFVSRLIKKFVTSSCRSIEPWNCSRRHVIHSTRNWIEWNNNSGEINFDCWLSIDWNPYNLTLIQSRFHTRVVVVSRKFFTTFHLSPKFNVLTFEEVSSWNFVFLIVFSLFRNLHCWEEEMEVEY